MKPVKPIPALIIAALLTLALYFIPQLDLLARPLALLSTVVHELGHGLTAIALGGTLHQLAMWPDGSGIALYSGDFSRLGFAAAAAGGLLGPPLAAMALFRASRGARAAKHALMLFAGILLVCCLLWVRNVFGLMFMGGLCALLALLIWKASAHALQVVTAFLALQLSLSVFSRGDYLFMREAQTAQGPSPSDTAQIASALWLPYWVWGALIALASLLIVWHGLRSAARSL